MKRLGFESLEKRELMAADLSNLTSHLLPTIDFEPGAYVGSDSTLRVGGSNQADQITLDTTYVRSHVYSGGRFIPTTQKMIRVSIADAQSSQLKFSELFAASAIKSLRIDAYGGNDRVMNNTNLPSIINGHDGNDVLFGGTGNDSIYGGLGNDRLLGGSGNDYIDGGDGNDSIAGGAGTDYLYGSDGDDQIDGGLHGDYVYGGAGNDRLTGGSGDDYVYGDAGNDNLNGDTSIYIQEGPSDTGPAGNDWMYGGAGNDTLYGQAGQDWLFGSDGNDTLRAGDGDDYAFGGSGNDTLNGENGDDYLSGENGVDTLDGGAGNDRLYGGGDDDLLFGTVGADYLNGGSGNDTLDGGADRDTLYGGDGNDLLRGGDGDDSLNGDNGHDTLYGNRGNDYLSGGAGNDGLYGGDGFDQLRGGSGGDRFLTQVDIVLDLTAEDANISFVDMPAGWMYSFAGWRDTTAGSWSADEIELVDVALGAMMERTGNTRILKMPDGHNLTFERRGEVTYGPGLNGVNLLNGTLVFSNDAFRDGSASDNDWVVQTVFHEVAHNWQGQPVFAVFRAVHVESDEFITEYARTNAEEDFGEMVAFSMMDYIGRRFQDDFGNQVDHAQTRTRLGVKLAAVDAFFASLAD